MSRLHRSEVNGYRDALLTQQKGLCLICGEKIEDDGVLDHCHTTGRVRAVLHRGCNRAEGVAKNALRWVGGGTPSVLRRIADYMEGDYSTQPLHPSHKLAEDKRLKLLRKRLKTVTAPATRKKIQAEIKQLVQLLSQSY